MKSDSQLKLVVVLRLLRQVRKLEIDATRKRPTKTEADRIMAIKKIENDIVELLSGSL